MDYRYCETIYRKGIEKILSYVDNLQKSKHELQNINKDEPIIDLIGDEIQTIISQ